MPLDRDAVRRVIDLLRESGAAELELGEEDRSVRVRRRDAEAVSVMAPPAATEPEPREPALAAAAAPDLLGQTEAKEAPQNFIVARMVGLFHRGAGPAEGEPLVEVGDSVAEGQVVATIEALRKLTEVTSPVAGEITEVLVEDGEPVQYGEELFAVKGAGEQD